MEPPLGRRRATTVLVVLAACVLFLAVVAGYAKRTLLDSDQFADRAAAALRDDSVSSLAAQQITDQLVLRQGADLLAARPLIQAVTGQIIGGGAFSHLFGRAVRDAHRAVFDRDENTVALTLVDAGTVVGAALEQLRPKLAAKLTREGPVELVKRHVGSAGSDLARLGDKLRPLPWLLALLTLALAAAAIVVAPDQRAAVSRLGTAAAAVGVAIVVAYAVARTAVVNAASGADARAAAGAVWDAFAADLRTVGWLLAAAGALVAGAAASLIRPVSIDEPLRRAWAAVSVEPASGRLRAARAVLLVAAGLFVALEPAAALQLVATATGVLLVFAGVQSLLRLVYRPRAAAPDVRAAPARGAGRRRRRFALLALAALVVVAAAGTLAGSDAVGESAAPIRGCEGHTQLCDRRFDDVVLAATHNSMSVPLSGWYSAEQDRPIAGQLEDGVRGLLLDTHYADKLANGRYRTYFGGPTDARRQVAEDGVGPQAVAAAMRLRNRLVGSGKGTRGMYLCHTFCELGATPLADGLRAIHDFLVTHPDDVVVVVNQDYVTPADFVKAVGETGLERYVYRGPTSGTWPTLRDMIRDDQRLVLLAENHAGTAPWYHPAYSAITEETPYTFKSAGALTDPARLAATCRPNRGPRSAPLFLVNHWVSTDPLPRPSDAARVNAYAPLVARARACRRIRGHLPNLLAVNFYKRGDVFRVVDTLNGVSPER